MGQRSYYYKDYKIEKDYGDVIGKKLSAKIESHDFSKADEAAKIINDFVSEVTAGKIPKLVDADSVNGAFSVIVNAIYFTAEWEHKFNRWGNSKEKFYNSEEKFREMDFMHHGMVRRDYAEDEDFQVLSLQYKDTSYAFNIFLPKKR
ncbi:hypothetical protein OESDEN_14646 [Oesophagostomum dentatum]|uniref:Serpin domain-containing protein n=1 Tax=Oesophagostomum dentatum TaxID=61180 RepID=A0A0B1SJZ5_OESDE|nr:hypothetical protein OESDEN_14646 [Oesophagostomum dentatum]